jgi:hypothetical protein
MRIVSKLGFVDSLRTGATGVGIVDFPVK